VGVLNIHDIMLAHNIPAYIATQKWRVLKVAARVATPGAESASHKPGGRLPLLSARPAVTLPTLKSAATNLVYDCTIYLSVRVAASMLDERPVATDVAWSVCLSVCWSHREPCQSG